MGYRCRHTTVPRHPGSTLASGQDRARVPWGKSGLRSPVSPHNDRRESLPALLGLQERVQGDGDRNAVCPHETGSLARLRPCLWAEATLRCDLSAPASSAGPPCKLKPRNSPCLSPRGSLGTVRGPQHYSEVPDRV